VIHRADMQIDRLDATKRPFHQGKGFIAAHRRGVVERLGGQAGTYDIDAVGCRLRGDPRVKTSCPYPALKGVTRLVMCR
jgi:hypothetical protein